MKKILRYFNLTLVCMLLATAFAACTDDDAAGSGNAALSIKVFSPVKVVPGQPVTINGTGFDKVTEVVFPGEVVVTDFENVGEGMIRVTTPAGIDSEGKLVVRTDAARAASPQAMTLGCTEPRSFSHQEGDTVKTKEVLWMYGKDMEFVCTITFQDEAGNPLVVEQKDFFRIATGRVGVKVPDDVKLDTPYAATFSTFDGKSFSMPVFNYQSGGSGHFETQRISFWKNGRESEIPAPNWSGEGRFANVENATGEETYAFTMDQWEVLKTQPFKIQIEPLTDYPNVRITTGWWSTAYGGGEYNCWEIAQTDDAGNCFIEINLAEWPDLLSAIDAQHLLFTGSDYRLIEIFQEAEVWVEEEGDSKPKEVIIWQNDGSHGEISWSGDYRFSNEENMTGEEIYAIPMDQWEVIRNGTFYLTAKGSDWVQMRITTGWWSTTWTGDDICTGSERIVDNEDGTYTIEINFVGDPILDLLDAQHLLFTGGGYTPLKLYYYKK